MFFCPRSCATVDLRASNKEEEEEEDTKRIFTGELVLLIRQTALGKAGILCNQDCLPFVVQVSTLDSS